MISWFLSAHHGLGRARFNRRNFKQFRRDFDTFAQQAAQAQIPIPLWSERLPCLGEATSQTTFDGHYIYHPAWAARILAQTRPEKHVDISSTLHFCTLISAFFSVDFYDYRPAPLQLDGLRSARADLNALPFESQSVSSLSCMHVVEHIGLGRYGDSLDPLGDVKAMRELMRVLAPEGNLLFVTPVGKPTIRFNGHRIYDPQTIVENFSELTLKQLALVPDDFLSEGFLLDATFEEAKAQNYGCGCFWFQR